MNALLVYLNSEFASEVVRRSGQTYSSGMDRIESNEMEGVPVLNPHDVNEETVFNLSQLFDELREAARSAGDTIDKIIKRIDNRLKNEL